MKQLKQILHTAEKMQIYMKFKSTSNYIATDELILAVNSSITIERPLLIKGEPGTGKTQLAEELAKQRAIAVKKAEEETLKQKVLNEKIAKIFLKREALERNEHRIVSKKNFLGQINESGPHYSFEFGDLKLFQEKLEKAKSRNLDFQYEFVTVENKFFDIILSTIY